MLPKVIVGIVILSLAIMILRPFDPTGPLGKISEKTPNQIFQNQSSQDTNSSNSGPVIFTHSIFNPEEIDFVSPLGESNGGYIEIQPLGGMTVNIKKEVAEKGPIEVYAPTDMELTSYAYTLMEPEPQADWSLYFKINDELTLVIHHIKNASQKIVDIAGSTPKKNDSRTTDVRGPNQVKFKAGEVIGTTTGTSMAKNWNIYLYDNSVKNEFINQKRYESNHIGQRLMNAACIFDYYEDQKTKDSFYTLLGVSAPSQTKSCGTSSKDKKGTLSGLWHLKKDGIDFGSYNGDYADPFSVYMRADKSVIIYEMGKKVFVISPTNPTHKDPETVTDSHCYLLTDNWNPSEYKGYAFFRVDSETQMSVVYSPTKSCPAEFPSEQTKTYYR